MASQQDQLLAEEEGFSKKSKQVKFKDRKIAPDDHHPSTLLPIYICHDRKSIDFSKQKTSKTKNSSKRVSLDSYKTTTIGKPAAIDEVAIKAVISILSGYIGRYSKDENFQNMIKEELNHFLERRKTDFNDDDDEVLASLRLGIESIDRLVQDQDTTKLESLLRSSFTNLSIIISSLSHTNNHNNNCHLFAFVNFYLSILYKIEKNDRNSATHLLQVFCHSPFLARTRLLSDLWEHLFLPHLLLLKVWYHTELEFLSDVDYPEKEKRIKALSKVYNEKMDQGTIQFAVYYKQWLSVGAESPAVPIVLPPSRPNYGSSRRRSMDSCTKNNNLYKTVFGAANERKSSDLGHRNRSAINAMGVEEETNKETNADSYNMFSKAHNKIRIGRGWIQQNKDSKFGIPPERQKHHERELSRAFKSICSSDNLTECEMAVRVLTKTWMNSHGDHSFLVSEFSRAPVIKGMLEVLFASDSNKVLELAISLLAELVTRRETNRQIILNSDPQLQIFSRLLESNSLFLKAAVLLYLLKPKVKQMVSSAKWVPLVLRVLEFGDHLQILFKVKCRADVAALYLLDQLLNGSDNEDKNIDNAREVVSVGGLGLLVGRMAKGKINERSKVVSMILCCLHTDERCWIHLVDNLNKESIVELLALENHNSNGTAILLLIELLLSMKREQMMEFLEGLNRGWGGLNTMQILLVYLQKASPGERLLAAAILLQLDLLGDPSKSSVYREEAVQTLITALDCQKSDEKVQQKLAKALTMLDGHFSYTPEKWILKLAVVDDEAEANRIWLENLATVLLKSGNKCLFHGLLNCIANGIPCLSRASLYFVAWISSFIGSARKQDFRAMAYSILKPQLQESSGCDRASDERLLASFALDRLSNSSAIQ